MIDVTKRKAGETIWVDGGRLLSLVVVDPDARLVQVDGPAEIAGEDKS